MRARPRGQGESLVPPYTRGSVSLSFMRARPISVECLLSTTLPPGVLNRAEWIKFMSVFFNEENKANLYFERESAAFKTTEVAVAKVAAATAARTCAWVGKYWSGGYAVFFATYKTDLCKSAGRASHFSAQPEPFLLLEPPDISNQKC